MRIAQKIVSFAIAVAVLALVQPPDALAAEQGSAAWLFLKLTDQAELEARAAAKHGDTKAANTWRAWERQYGESAVSPAIEGKSALQITDELATGNDAAAARAHDPREIALERASATFWRGLHAQLAQGAPLTIAFPKREMLTPVPGLKGTPWDARHSRPLPIAHNWPNARASASHRRRRWHMRMPPGSTEIALFRS